MECSLDKEVVVPFSLLGVSASSVEGVRERDEVRTLREVNRYFLVTGLVGSCELVRPLESRSYIPVSVFSSSCAFLLSNSFVSILGPVTHKNEMLSNWSGCILFWET